MLLTEGAARADLGRFAKCVCKTHMRIFIEVLIADKDDEIVMPYVEQPLFGGIICGLTKIDPDNFCANRR